MHKTVNSANRNNETVLSIVRSLKRYRFLIEQLVSRDFKLKYKRSVLGALWSFLNPLLYMAVLYVVFSALFKFDIEYYPVYILSGIVMFNFFSESTSLTMNSIIDSAALIKKVYVPKYIYPLTRTLSSTINLLISMIPLLAAILISGIRPSLSFLLIIVPVVCIFVFCLGVGMLLATAMSFFRDTQYLWGVICTIWMYLTPIFYPVSILPDNATWIVKSNPLYYYVDFTRICIIEGTSPDVSMYVICVGSAVISLILGACVFNKAQDRFILYL